MLASLLSDHIPIHQYNPISIHHTYCRFLKPHIFYRQTSRHNRSYQDRTETRRSMTEMSYNCIAVLVTTNYGHIPACLSSTLQLHRRKVRKWILAPTYGCRHAEWQYITRTDLQPISNKLACMGRRKTNRNNFGLFSLLRTCPKWAQTTHTKSGWKQFHHPRRESCKTNYTDRRLLHECIPIPEQL